MKGFVQYTTGLKLPGSASRQRYVPANSYRMSAGNRKAAMVRGTSGVSRTHTTYRYVADFPVSPPQTSDNERYVCGDAICGAEIPTKTANYFSG